MEAGVSKKTENLCFLSLLCFFMVWIMDDKKNIKLNKIKKKYVSEEKLIIAKVARKTLRYIEKNTENFPNKYIVLRNRIINTCYDILEYIYRANVFQELND